MQKTKMMALGVRSVCKVLSDGTWLEHVLVLLYDSETVVWRKKKRSTIRAVELYNLKSLLVTIRMVIVCTDKRAVWSDKRKGRAMKGLMKVSSDGSAIL